MQFGKRNRENNREVEEVEGNKMQLGKTNPVEESRG